MVVWFGCVVALWFWFALSSLVCGICVLIRLLASRVLLFVLASGTGSVCCDLFVYGICGVVGLCVVTIRRLVWFIWFVSVCLCLEVCEFACFL